MNKKFLIALSSLFLLPLAIGVSSFSRAEKVYASVGHYTTDAATYYNGITATSGKELAAQLHDLITSTHRTYTTYDDNGKNEYQINTDQYYENGVKVNGYIYEFYSGVKWPAGWYPDAGDTRGGYSREHCWCQSNSNGLWGTTGGGADMHHLRPVENRLNTSRSNNRYGEFTSGRDNYKTYAKLGTNTTYALGGYVNASSDLFEPLDFVKGDVARIILYTYLHYNSYTVSDLFGSHGTTNGNGSSNYFASSKLALTKIVNKSSESAALELLLKWNTNDPVDDIERRRNEQVAVYQGNRNPFIDNSSYADAIWGTATVGIKSISKTTASVTVGNSTSISATSSNSGTISWSSSNTSVATVSSATAASGANINITGVATGSATITASITISGQTYSKTCAVTVSSAKTLSNIAVSDAITSFVVGDTWDFGGTVTATYSDSSTADVTVNTTFSGYDMSSSGDQTVTATYTEGGVTATTTYTINVEAASGDTTTVSVSIGTYATAHEWANATKYTSVVIDSNVTASVSHGGGNTGKYYTSGNEWRYYQGESAEITITVAAGYELDSVTFTYNINNNGLLYDSDDDAVASGSAQSVSGTSVTFYVGNSDSTGTSGQVRFTNISVTYHEIARKLSSISIDTSEVQTVFYQGTTFNADGIVVTAYYSDETSEDVTSSATFEGYDMDVADEYTVVVGYTEAGRTRTAEYNIIVKEPEVEYITASVDKTYYVGETIVKSDITVTDNLEHDIVDFTFTSYTFRYSDAASGGALTDKEFTITYEQFETTLTVQVQRKARRNSTVVSDTLTQSTTGVTGTTYTAFSGKTKALDGINSDATYAGQCAGGNSSIQLRSAKDSSNNYSGVITTTSGGVCTNISVVWNSNTSSGRSITIYGKDTAYSSANDLFNNSTRGTSIGTITYGTSTSVNVSGSYSYIGIRASDPLYLTSITITYTVPDNTAVNLANYVMYEDTAEQCTTKFATAKGYFENLSVSERNVFMSSDDYVISTARERFEAWARNRGQTITHINGDFTIASVKSPVLQMLNSSDGTTILIVLISFLSIATITSCFFLKRKRR